MSRSIARLSCWALISVVIACGPRPRDAGSDAGDSGGGTDSGTSSGHDPGDGNGCTGPACATISGRVWAPKWALGDVPPGQEVPIFNASIYVSDTKPPPIPQQTFCEPCNQIPAGAASSSHDGSFELTVKGNRHYWLVIKKGPFRLEQEIDVTTGAVTLPPQDTTLPHQLDGANGAWIPKVAIVRGSHDAIEDILGKVGFGTMAGDKLGTPDGEITFYDWGVTGPRSAEYLIQHLDELRSYHIIFFPCTYAVNSALLQDQSVLRNLRQFVADGGKLYVTDWSGEVADRAFPPQIEFGGFGAIDSTGTYDPVTLTGTLTQAGTADGDKYHSSDARAVDANLNAWIGLQTGPSETSPVPMPYNPNAFQAYYNWNYIESLTSVMKGSDAMGNPVYDEPKAWVTASDGQHGQRPVAVTYEPTGCGKVLYSTFQTSGEDAENSTRVSPCRSACCCS